MKKSAEKLDYFRSKLLNFKDQDFEALRKECLSKKCLFEDPLFPAVDLSISYTRPPPYDTVWKRPFEILDESVEPVFMIDGFQSSTADDLHQGQLGDWYVN
jgi:calpain